MTFILAHAVKVELEERRKGMPVRKLIKPCHVLDLSFQLCDCKTIIARYVQVCSAQELKGAQAGLLWR